MVTKEVSLSFYDEDYFKKYGEKGYTLETTRWILKPFATSIGSLVSILGFKPQLRALDVGCAKGYFVKMLRGMGIEAYGVDISEYAVNNALDEVKTSLYRVDVESEVLPFKEGFFDLVISIATLEHLHLRRLPFTLLSIHRVLKPSGLLIINVPNPLNKVEAEKPDHITMLGMKGWIRLIKNSGFHYEPKLSKFFDSVRVKEIATLYILSRHSFNFMSMRIIFPKGMKDMVMYLMMLKRKLFTPNFSLIFRRA